jgi:hypothetical protein
MNRSVLNCDVADSVKPEFLAGLNMKITVFLAVTLYTLKMKAVGSSETFVVIYQTTRRHIQKIILR